MGLGDKDAVDGRDRRTIVCEIRQLRRDKRELVEKNDSLTKEKKELAEEKKVTERREKGERLLRIGYQMKEGGGERVSAM